MGMRFALLELKMALVELLRKYNIKKCAKTVETVKLDPGSQLGTPKDDLIVKIERR